MCLNALQLKKEVERAWDSDKDRDATPASKPKPVHGSTKRVEQFRKNMRRWMIGESSQTPPSSCWQASLTSHIV